MPCSVLKTDSSATNTRPGGHGTLSASLNEPQSLSDPQTLEEGNAEDEADEQSGLLVQEAAPKKRRRRRVGGCFKPMALVNWVLVLGLVIIVVLLARASREMGKGTTVRLGHSKPLLFESVS